MDLSSLGSIPQAVATVFAAGVALYVSRNWRRQEIGKRRQTVAEEALLAAYEAERAIDVMRRPVVLQTELENEAGLDRLAAGQIAFRRYDRHRAEWAKLEKAALLVSVHFGASVSKPISQLQRHAHTVPAEIIEGLEPLIDRTAGAKSVRPASVLQYTWRPARPKSPDPEGEKIRKTMSAIEQTLRPHLRMPGERDPDAPCRRWWERHRR